MKLFDTEINGQILDVFKAHLVSYTVGACSYDNGYMSPPSSIFPVRLDGKVGLRSVVMTMDFEGDSFAEISLNISNLTAMLHKEALLFLPDGFYYTCVFEGASEPKEKAPWILQVKFTFSGVRHKALKTESFTQSGKMYVDGNYKSSAIVRIVPNTGTTEVTVNGITVQNIAGEVVIDGIKKTVMQNGVNKFADTNMTEFPYFECGENDVTINGNATVELSYYPIFL